ncbi:unnamed protein product [Adineta steineri]|uniref:LIM zinc-binding domain-containing protein n=1 Tax=Adineta steineri TaxID=433720 RepID=A0A819JY39_9BILA|nr:unnamed protein product [Adineta steineri]CAF3940516.1 unnamed protein product [Adineta steineri]
MATLLEQCISQNTCFACGALVYAVEKKITTNHIYHNRCFRCRICKRNLTGYSLNEEGDDIYCGNCYRRKQRGDCNSFEFYRAAAERAQYVHNRHHTDQQNMLMNTRSRSLRETSTPRHPSIALRQLEREFLSYREPKTNSHDELINDLAQKPLATSQPLTINTNFSTPINLTNFRRDDLLLTKYEPSTHISRICSPSPTIRTETIIKPRIKQQTNENINNDDQTKSITIPTGSATGGIEFRLNKSSIDLTNVTSPQTNRKNIIIPDLDENKEHKESKFRFPDFNLASIRRRSTSAHHLKKLIRAE